MSFMSNEEKQKRVSASTPEQSPQALLASPGILAPGLPLRGMGYIETAHSSRHLFPYLLLIL